MNNIITNFIEFDPIPNKTSYKKYIILSFSEDFRNKIVSNIDTENSLVFSFKESSPHHVQNWNEYVIFFMKLLNESHILIIDTEYYSEGFKLLQSCAINSKTIEEILIYKNQYDKNNYRIISETDTNSPFCKKERTIII